MCDWGPLWPLGLLTLRARPGFLSQRPGGVGVCVCAHPRSGICVCERAGGTQPLNVGGGGAGGWPSLGVMAAAFFVWGWAVLGPTSGRERAAGRRGAWKGGWTGHLVSPGLPSLGFFASARFPQGPLDRGCRGRRGRVSGVESFVTQKIRGGVGGRGGSNGSLRAWWRWALDRD